MKRPMPSLRRFLEALDDVKTYVVHLRQVLGEADEPVAAHYGESRPAPSRRIHPKDRKPSGTWPTAIKAVLATNGAAMRKIDIAQKIADIQNVPVSSLTGIVSRALYEMKRSGKVSHDKAAETYSLRSARKRDSGPVLGNREQA